MTRGDSTQVKKLREENDSLKSQLDELHDEFNEMKKKLETHASKDELQDSVNLMSVDYNDLKAKRSAFENGVKKIDEKLAEFPRKYTR